MVEKVILVMGCNYSELHQKPSFILLYWKSNRLDRQSKLSKAKIQQILLSMLVKHKKHCGNVIKQVLVSRNFLFVFNNQSIACHLEKLFSALSHNY